MNPTLNISSSSSKFYRAARAKFDEEPALALTEAVTEEIKSQVETSMDKVLSRFDALDRRLDGFDRRLDGFRWTAVVVIAVVTIIVNIGIHFLK